MAQLYCKVVYIESNAQKELLTFPPTTRKDFVVLREIQKAIRRKINISY